MKRRHFGLATGGGMAIGLAVYLLCKVQFQFLISESILIGVLTAFVFGALIYLVLGLDGQEQ